MIRKCWDLVREGEMFTKDKAKVTSWGVVFFFCWNQNIGGGGLGWPTFFWPGPNVEPPLAASLLEQWSMMIAGFVTRLFFYWTRRCRSTSQTGTQLILAHFRMKPRLEFYCTGACSPFQVSALNGSGIAGKVLMNRHTSTLWKRIILLISLMPNLHRSSRLNSSILIIELISLKPPEPSTAFQCYFHEEDCELLIRVRSTSIFRVEYSTVVPDYLQHH